MPFYKLGLLESLQRVVAAVHYTGPTPIQQQTIPLALEAKAALKPGGVLAVWSTRSDNAFTKRLRASGLDIEEVPLRACGSRGRWHNIWLAKK